MRLSDVRHLYGFDMEEARLPLRPSFGGLGLALTGLSIVFVYLLRDAANTPSLLALFSAVVTSNLSALALSIVAVRRDRNRHLAVVSLIIACLFMALLLFCVVELCMYGDL